MSANAAEWIMAAATVASAVFVGSQAWLLRETLDDHAESNLQNKQIEACADFLIAMSESKQSYVSWVTAARGESPVLNFETHGDFLYSRAIERALAVGSSASRMKLYSDKKTDDHIDSLLSVKTAFLMLLNETPPSTKANDNAWFAQYESSFDVIKNRCNLAFEGKAGGFL